MPFTPLAGSVAKIVTVNNGTNTIHPAINWNLNIDPKARDVSNFRDGRFRLKTLTDVTLSFTVIYDAAAPPQNTSGGAISDGAIVTALCYVNTNAYYSVPCMITSVGPKNEGVEGTILQDTTAMLHNGTVTYPS